MLAPAFVQHTLISDEGLVIFMTAMTVLQVLIQWSLQHGNVVLAKSVQVQSKLLHLQLNVNTLVTHNL